ncbi:hypothetical protein BHAOGJBA_6374 [Methylobacterium hispanicum]|uniref:Uncharacterized protein n=1 Tax=Methylobacterium hispanicum TaxID=270350 RepID=A0AAV4ZW54_9HYPH|nr:hypothetical protein BHAOGJBA_6374 [Methylobacterium hispanicum]
MPSVLPRTSTEPMADLSHSPACAPTERGVMRRKSITISPMTSSATERVLEKGALKTGMPRPRAAGRSTWLVPTEKQPTASSRSAAANAASSSWVRERMPRMCTPRSAACSASRSSAFGRRTRFV